MTDTNYLYTIEVLIGGNTTGENTHEENLIYVNALRSALESAYPNANISVEMSSNDSSTWSSTGFDYLDDVDEKINSIQNRVWEKMFY